MKIHLKRVVGKMKLTFEVFATIITQVEACLKTCKLEISCSYKKTILYLRSGPWDALLTPTQERMDLYEL